jgi:hypothetical protein
MSTMRTVLLLAAVATLGFGAHPPSARDRLFNGKNLDGFDT